MAKDFLGADLKTGDAVTLVGIIERVKDKPDGTAYLTVRAARVVPPETTPTYIALNARQVEKVVAKDPAVPEPDAKAEPTGNVETPTGL